MTAEPGDEGCLRWVLGGPLVLLHLVAAWFLYLALTIRPSGSWDDDAYAAIELSCLITIAASLLALAVTAVPPVRKAMGSWWLAPPLVLGGAAVLRLALGVGP
ncbi:hypothetical protein [Streptomyces sp. NPDC002054]|uniref:hypothetical protein n=1 Tax=Streptomyces sp. NPDC002054 TaxID=3154663 RepID=UPI0033191841